jgi:hypothetical protein
MVGSFPSAIPIRAIAAAVVPAAAINPWLFTVYLQGLVGLFQNNARSLGFFFEVTLHGHIPGDELCHHDQAWFRRSSRPLAANLIGYFDVCL